MADRISSTKKPFKNYSISSLCIMTIILLLPITGFIGLVSSPFNWIAGIIAEVIFIVYLLIRIRRMYGQEKVEPRL